MNAKRWFAWACLALMLVAEIFLFRANHERDAALADLRDARQQLQQTQAELSDLKTSSAGLEVAEVSSLRKQNEVLTGKVAALQKNVEQLQAESRQTAQHLTTARTALELQQEHLKQLQTEQQQATLVANANAGAWLAAAEQVAKRTQAPLLKALKAQKVPTIASRYIQIALDTELGSGAYAVALGTLLPFIPRLADNKRAVKLAGYLQAHGMKTIISILVDPIIDGVEKVFLQAMKSLPDDTL